MVAAISNRINKVPKFLVLGAFCIFLSACSEAWLVGTAVLPSIAKSPEEVNLTDMNYGAADMMASQSVYLINKRTSIAIKELDNTNKIVPEGMEHVPPATFGKVVAEQVGARFVQLGYNVVDGNSRSAQAKISGFYSVVGEKVQVSLRLQKSDGRILSAYNYSIPRWDPEVKDMLGHEGKGNAIIKSLQDMDFMPKSILNDPDFKPSTKTNLNN
jgi:hypothetical protein